MSKFLPPVTGLKEIPSANFFGFPKLRRSHAGPSVKPGFVTTLEASLVTLLHFLPFPQSPDLTKRASASKRVRSFERHLSLPRSRAPVARLTLRFDPLYSQPPPFSSEMPQKLRLSARSSNGYSHRLAPRIELSCWPTSRKFELLCPTSNDSVSYVTRGFWVVYSEPFSKPKPFPFSSQ